MSDQAEASNTSTEPTGNPVNARNVALWEAGIFVWVMLVASALHFAYELSGFQPWATIFGSVNESTAEHLKIFFWPMLIATLVQHAYMRNHVNNFWWGKAAAIVVAPIVLMISFYFYLGISLPIYGRGFLIFDIGTGALGVLVGNIVSYKILTAPPMGSMFRNIGITIIVVLTLHATTMAYFMPRFFIYENFMRYNYAGEFGILPDYTDYLIFRTPEEYEALQAAESASQR